MQEGETPWETAKKTKNEKVKVLFPNYFPGENIAKLKAGETNAKGSATNLEKKIIEIAQDNKKANGGGDQIPVQVDIYTEEEMANQEGTHNIKVKEFLLSVSFVTLKAYGDNK